MQRIQMKSYVNVFFVGNTCAHLNQSLLEIVPFVRGLVFLQTIVLTTLLKLLGFTLGLHIISRTYRVVSWTIFFFFYSEE